MDQHLTSESPSNHFLKENFHVKIVDPSTDKVIKEIPSADVQQLQIKIREAFGLLVDEKI